MHLFWDLEGTILNPSVSSVDGSQKISQKIIQKNGCLVFADQEQIFSALSLEHSLYLATSKSVSTARRNLDQIEYARFFRNVYGRDSFPGCFSKGDVIAKAVEELKIDEGDCVMVGDRHHDIQAGKGNGFCTVGVLWGNGSRAELLGAGADFLVENLKDLCDLIDSLVL